MTPLLDYANAMLSIYVNDNDWKPTAIRHYLELAMQERMRIDRERELERIMEEYYAIEEE